MLKITLLIIGAFILHKNECFMHNMGSTCYYFAFFPCPSLLQGKTKKLVTQHCLSTQCYITSTIKNVYHLLYTLL